MRDTCVQCGKRLDGFAQAFPVTEQRPTIGGATQRRTIDACSLACAQAWSDATPWPVDHPDREREAYLRTIFNEGAEPSPSDLESQRRMLS